MGGLALSGLRADVRAIALVAFAMIALALSSRPIVPLVSEPPIAGAQSTPTGTPIDTPTGTPTPPPDTERDTLLALGADPDIGWDRPELETMTEDDGTIRTTIMQGGDGTLELARISRYGSALQARNAFGDRRPVYFGMQARRGEESEHTGEAFRDTSYIEFRHGPLIFRVETRYERAACGFAREPDGISARLAEQAVAHGLIPPWADPTPACDTKVSVDPVPCVVAGDSVVISGRTSIPDCDVIVDGGRRRVETPPLGGLFRVDVPLEAGTAHRLYVGHLLCRIECDGGTFRDADGAPLRVWSVDGIAIPGMVYLPWGERMVR